jgi:hypothetical protein
MSERHVDTENERSIRTLTDQLIGAGIDISLWGAGGAKTVAHLHQEIEEGESQMTFSPEGVTRSVRVAWVDVLYLDTQGDIYCLVEDRQEYNDGRTRTRSLSTSLGEKLKPHESAPEGALRAIEEELGIKTVQSLHALGSESTTHTPDSYPGLESQYETHAFAAVIDEASYDPSGYIEIQADKTNYYVWEKIHSSKRDF